MDGALCIDAIHYIKVILPIKLGWEPFYSLPQGECAQVGDRVRVPFAGKSYLAVVSAVDIVPDISASKIREAYGLDHAKDKVSPEEISFWRMLSEYYMCTIGEVYKAAYPSVKDELVRAKKKEEAFVPMADALEDLSDEHKTVADSIQAALMGASVPVFGANATGANVPGANTHSGVATKPVLANIDDEDDVMLELCLRNRDKNILLLVPEVKFSRSLEQRARKVLGSRLVLWGSHQTPARRREAGRRVRGIEPYVVLGTRSAIFLPFNSLGLVMVQNEHEASYKQTSPAPRYNGRDAAMLLASVHGARVLLQSATPSLESLYNARSGKYNMVSSDAGLAFRTEVVDVRAELRKKGMRGEVALKMMEAASASSCPAFYKPRRAGYPKTEILLPQLQATFGPGVFYTEDLLENPLPSGTDMLGIFGTDSLLGRLDFRADERLVQTVFQAAGQCRSTLKNVVIQTKDSSHPVFKSLSGGDLSLLFAERQEFGYPPFTRIVDILVHDEYQDRAARMLSALGERLSALNLATVMPLGQAGIRIFLARDRMLTSRKCTIMSLVEDFEKQNKYPSHLYFDVDPQ